MFGVLYRLPLREDIFTLLVLLITFQKTMDLSFVEKGKCFLYIEVVENYGRKTDVQEDQKAHIRQWWRIYFNRV